MALVAGGWRHTLAADSEGRLFSAGWGKFGQCGLGSCEDVVTPRQVEVSGRVPGATTPWLPALSEQERGRVTGAGAGCEPGARFCVQLNRAPAQSEACTGQAWLCWAPVNPALPPPAGAGGGAGRAAGERVEAHAGGDGVWQVLLLGPQREWAGKRGGGRALRQGCQPLAAPLTVLSLRAAEIWLLFSMRHQQRPDPGPPHLAACSCSALLASHACRPSLPRRAGLCCSWAMAAPRTPICRWRCPPSAAAASTWMPSPGTRGRVRSWHAGAGNVREGRAWLGGGDGDGGGGGWGCVVGGGEKAPGRKGFEGGSWG